MIKKNQLPNLQHSYSISGGKGGPVYSEVDGTVKMYLKGRPVVLHKPDDVVDYDLNTPSQMPDKKLLLDWVLVFVTWRFLLNKHLSKHSNKVY